MSNWRINFGVGPLRYNRAINGKSPKKQEPNNGGNPFIHVLVFLGTMVLLFVCCGALMD